jgi:hypothetical protein
MGKDLCQVQDTPPTNKKDEFVHFGQTVEIPKPLEDLPVGTPAAVSTTRSRALFFRSHQAGLTAFFSFLTRPADCAVFMEFKHFKPKKNKISTKCFCLLEMDEIRKGQFPLEMSVWRPLGATAVNGVGRPFSPLWPTVVNGVGRPFSLTLARCFLSPSPLHSYAKPTDFKRKKLSLLTEKPHYLYISISLTVG